MDYVIQYKRKEKRSWFHHANDIEKIHLKYIESAILAKINTGLLFNGKTINGNVINVYIVVVFLNRYKTIIIVHL